MKKKLLILGVIMTLTLTSCGVKKEKPEETKATKETVQQTEATQATEAETDPAHGDDLTYISGVINTSDRIATTLGDMSTYISEQSNLIGTAQYNNQIAVYCSDLSIILADVKSLKPSEKFEEVHADYLQAADIYQTVADELPGAIRDLNVTKIEELTDNMYKGSDYIQSATKKIQDINQQ